MFGFTISRGGNSNINIKVTDIIKDGVADNDGQLRVRNIPL